MKLIHISDIHLTENGNEIWGVSTFNHFCKTIQKIKDLDGIDVIVVSGDLSDDGSRWTYEYIDKAFSEIGIPTFCCPGNHDNLSEFYHGYKPEFYKTCKAFELCGWNFIMLNSAVAGMSRGFFKPEILYRQIQQCSGPVTIVLHHPPIEQKGWLNRKLLENRNEFDELIQRFKNVKLVLYGHTHYHAENMVNGIVYSSASSTGFAFHPDFPKFEIAHGKEGFSIITLEENRIEIENILI
ncbi:MAG TPA: metallophosphoesterase [Bacteroidetes bacterium]|nr:metallophosphoesterase [Candidatus Limimorpha avicola]